MNAGAVTGTRHQGRGGADRHRGGHDPDVGAALRLPRAGAHAARATASTPRTTSRRCGACSPTASAACRSPPRSSARARRDRATDRPSLYGVLAAGDPPPRSQLLTQAHADRALARDRGRDDLARRRAGGGRGLPARAQLPRGRAPLPRDGADRRRRGRVRRLRRAAAGATTRRSRSRSTHGDGLGNEWAVVVDAPGYAACLLGWEQPHAGEVPDRERALRGDLDARRARGAPGVRRSARRWRGAADAALGDAAWTRCSTTGRWRWSSRRRR